MINKLIGLNTLLLFVFSIAVRFKRKYPPTGDQPVEKTHWSPEYRPDLVPVA
ncbi:hypothetical protein ACFFGT_05015 [Mucilaginibacter angelicae]|uniref:Uncharacterized protein n=1 Tax=Mucilaginibacter angelicae TaxID=869718 RepID=A0ABV6L1L3_9SPHI